MRWTERQLAMLREMGLRVWSPEAAGGVAGDEMADVAVAEGEAEPATATTAATTPRARERGVADAALPPATRAGEPSGPSVSPSPSIPPGPTSTPSLATPEASTPALLEADWLVVAEAPVAAADEERLLAAMLRAVRVSFDAPMRSGRAARVVVDAGLRERLARIVETVRPRVVLALGRAAAAALIDGDEPLGRLRGRIHAFGDLAAIVTLAPSYLLRHPAEKAKAWADLCLAVRAAGDAAARGD